MIGSAKTWSRPLGKRRATSMVDSCLAEPMSARQSGGALGRGLLILETLVKEVFPLSAAEIAQLCNLDVSTVYRLLQTLCESGHSLRDDKTKRYVASPKTLFPQQLYHPANISRRASVPPLTLIRDEVGHTAGFIFFYKGQRVLAELVPGRDQLSPYYLPWLDNPLHASGGGKIMLMEMSVKDRRTILGPPPWQTYTENTMTREEELFNDLDLSRKRGYVIARDDFLMGYSVVAAPVRTSSRDIIGCFFVTGQSQGFPEVKIPEIGCVLVQHANLFSTMPSLQSLAHVLRLS